MYTLFPVTQQPKKEVVTKQDRSCKNSLKKIKSILTSNSRYKQCLRDTKNTTTTTETKC